MAREDPVESRAFYPDDSTISPISTPPKSPSPPAGLCMSKLRNLAQRMAQRATVNEGLFES